MENNLFRENSLKKISSPDELNDYIKISKPNIWLTISALFIILISFLVWSMHGSIISKVDAVGFYNNSAKQDSIECYLSLDKIDKIKTGLEARIYVESTKSNIFILGKVKNIDYISFDKNVNSPVDNNFGNNVALVHIEMCKSTDGKYVCNNDIYFNENPLTSNVPYRVEIVVESIHPISFLFDKGA